MGSNNDMIYTCEFCSKTFREANKYLLHQKYHRFNENFLCVLCDIYSKTYASFIIHLARNHGNTKGDKSKKNNVSNFKCKVCQKDFGSASELLKHTKDYFLLKQEVLCLMNNCHKPFKTYNGLKSHYYRIHHHMDNVGHSDDTSIPEDLSNQHLDTDNQNSNIFSESNTSDLQDRNLKTEVALFLLKLHAQKLVPESTIQQVIFFTIILSLSAKLLSIYYRFRL